MYQVAVSRRMQHRDWTPNLPPNSDKKMQESPPAVLCRINNDYRRNIRQWAAPKSTSDEEVARADGTVLALPGEDARVPEAPEWPEVRCPRLRPQSATLPSSDVEGDPRVLPSTQTPARSQTEDRDDGFMRRHWGSSRWVASTPGRTPALGYGEALDHAMIQWPANTDLYGLDPWDALLGRDIFPDVTLAHLSASNAFTRSSKVGPTSRALGASGALIVDAQEFRRCGENGALGTTPGGQAL